MADQTASSIQAATLFSVNGFVVVITGGGSGLGAYMARALASNGASKVFIIGRREESLRKVADSIDDKSIIVPVVGDVSSKTSLKEAYETISKQVSHVDVLIANSGITGPSVPTANPDKTPLSIEELSRNILAPETDEVANTFVVNVIGVHYTIATFLPLLDAANKKRPQTTTAENFRPRPQIITTGSIGGLSRLFLGNITYGPSKAAILHSTKQLATLLVPYDIRINAIAPGLYLSEMTQDMYNKIGKTETHNVEGTFAKDMVPATRSGDEQDIAGAILFLCSRAGAYINGNILVTDGGRLGVCPSAY